MMGQRAPYAPDRRSIQSIHTQPRTSTLNPGHPQFVLKRGCPGLDRIRSCVLSETVRPRPLAAVLEWFESQEELALFVSVLTLGEFHKGIAKLPDGKRKQLLAEWVDGAFVPRFGHRVLPVDNAVAAAWGDITGVAEREGKPVPVIDGLIAATSRVHGLAVVTCNTKHFVRCNVPVVDPWAGA